MEVFSNTTNVGLILGPKSKNDHISGTAGPISKVFQIKDPIRFYDKKIAPKSDLHGPASVESFVYGLLKLYAYHMNVNV